MRSCILQGATLERARLSDVNLAGANLKEARLAGASLERCNLTDADLRGADLRGAHMAGATLVNTNIDGADLTAAHIYGLSVWDLETGSAKVRDLVITKRGDPPITVDNLEVAQFIYLMLNNRNIRAAIDTISTKVVLILGRFTPERKQVLEALRLEIRRLGYLPVLFDFDSPTGRDLTETISLLAHLARFIVADLTDARSLPQELQRIVPDLPSVPVQPILKKGAGVYAMFEHLQRYPWVLSTAEYSDAGLAAQEVESLLNRVETYRLTTASARPSP
jgi:uncharacterized protein YjbI with pentapeptide repeats